MKAQIPTKNNASYLSDDIVDEIMIFITSNMKGVLQFTNAKTLYLKSERLWCIQLSPITVLRL